MITPMLKYSFLVYHQEYQQFLTDLQEIGVVEPIQREVSLDMKTAEGLALMRQISNRLDFLRRRKIEPSIRKDDLPATDLILRMDALETEREQLIIQQNALQKEFHVVEPWGNFDKAVIDALQKAGCRLRFYFCAEKKFDTEWERHYYLARVNHIQSTVYFVVFQLDDEELSIRAEEVKIPQRSPEEVLRIQQTIRERIGSIDGELDEIAAHRTSILKEHLDWLETVTDYGKALLHASDEAGEKVKVLQGWAPASRTEELDRYLQDSGVLYVSEKPLPGDRVPILLRNNRFSKLYEPIGKLFSLPDYSEIDLTPFFAPFFMLFFGFCMADAGYGVLILVGASIMKLRSGKKVRPVLTLAQFFGVATAFFGLLTGNLFGISMAGLVAFEPIKEYFLNNDKVFMMAVAIGMFQILFGTAIRAVNQIMQYGFVYGLSSIGWIMMVLGLLDMALFKLTGLAGQVILYAGIFLVVFFSNPRASILGRIGKGIWDLYGITGIFGDVLSYIRLFALGVSSSILGFVINDIAVQIRDGLPAVIGVILFVIFLLLGHALNIVISALGAFVHPLRLTFVEFYKNAGFTGGGKQYKPFSKKSIIKE
jgi:V/A-type H+-transporting ATPase subunit I